MVLLLAGALFAVALYAVVLRVTLRDERKTKEVLRGQVKSLRSQNHRLKDELIWAEARWLSKVYFTTNSRMCK